MLTGGSVRQIYEPHGVGLSIRGIAERLELPWNTVRKYLWEFVVPVAKKRPERQSTLDPYGAFLAERIGAGALNTSVLPRRRS
jgi:hypothetical protein